MYECITAKSALPLENNYVHYQNKTLDVYVSHHVSAQINAEDGDGSERKRNVDQDEEQEGSDLRDVAGQCIGDGLLQVIKDETTWERKKKQKHRHIITRVIKVFSLIQLDCFWVCCCCFFKDLS